MRFHEIAIGVCLVAALLLGGCAGVSNARKIDYRNTRTLPSLEVPPDLAALPEPNLPGASQNSPPGSATFSGYAGEQRPQPGAGPVVLPRYPNVRLVREGQARYVVVQAEPAAVWGQVREFLESTGLNIASENPQAGLLETGWAENRALVGASESNPVARWFKSFFSVGLRDKYRVRLEHGVAPGTTEIYLTHQGMEEVAPDEEGNARPGWRPRPRDPELEAEMLARLVVHLGGEREPEKTVVAHAPSGSAPATGAPAQPSTTSGTDAAPEPPSARLTRNGNGTPLLTLEDSLDRAWRRVGLSLDRIGFTVEDRDRSKGIYYVRYIDPELQRERKGFFARLFSGEEEEPPTQYQVHVKPAENGTNVEVLDPSGAPAAPQTGERILSLLYEQLK